MEVLLLVLTLGQVSTQTTSLSSDQTSTRSPPTTTLESVYATDVVSLTEFTTGSNATPTPTITDGGIFIPTKITVGGFLVDLRAPEVIALICILGFLAIVGLGVFLCCCCFAPAQYCFSRNRSNDRSRSSEPTNGTRPRMKDGASSSSLPLRTSSMLNEDLKSSPSMLRTRSNKDGTGSDSRLGSRRNTEHKLKKNKTGTSTSSKNQSEKSMKLDTMPRSQSSLPASSNVTNTAPISESFATPAPYDANSGYNPTVFEEADFIPPVPAIPAQLLQAAEPVYYNGAVAGTEINYADYVPTQINHDQPQDMGTYIMEADLIEAEDTAHAQ